MGLGLADSVGVALAGGMKVAPDEGRIEWDSMAMVLKFHASPWCLWVHLLVQELSFLPMSYNETKNSSAHYQ